MDLKVGFKYTRCADLLYYTNTEPLQPQGGSLRNMAAYEDSDHAARSWLATTFKISKNGNHGQAAMLALEVATWLAVAGEEAGASRRIIGQSIMEQMEFPGSGLPRIDAASAVVGKIVNHRFRGFSPKPLALLMR